MIKFEYQVLYLLIFLINSEIQMGNHHILLLTVNFHSMT